MSAFLINALLSLKVNTVFTALNTLLSNFNEYTVVEGGPGHVNCDWLSFQSQKLLVLLRINTVW